MKERIVTGKEQEWSELGRFRIQTLQRFLAKGDPGLEAQQGATPGVISGGRGPRELLGKPAVCSETNRRYESASTLICDGIYTTG